MSSVNKGAGVRYGRRTDEKEKKEARQERRNRRTVLGHTCMHGALSPLGI